MSTVIKKKICMVGSFAVGKTSLVRQYVQSIFSEKYHTTVGVKIDKKSVTVDDRTVDLVLWDVQGEDEFQKVHTAYLRGMSGYLLVADGTRLHTLDTALRLKEMVDSEIGNIPFIFIINKSDLAAEWAIERDTIDRLSQERGWVTLETSAKTGFGVEDAFLTLAKEMVT
jgi:small GTP-binding protein